MILSKDKLYYAKFHYSTKTDNLSIEMYFYVNELKNDGKDLKAVCNDTPFIIKGIKGVSLGRENIEFFADTRKWKNLEEIKEVPKGVYKLDSFLLH